MPARWQEQKPAGPEYRFKRSAADTALCAFVQRIAAAPTRVATTARPYAIASRAVMP